MSKYCETVGLDQWRDKFDEHMQIGTKQHVQDHSKKTDSYQIGPLLVFGGDSCLDLLNQEKTSPS